jgi:hypothetical protein
MNEQEKQKIVATAGSVIKWMDIAFNYGVDHGTADCPLCTVYFTPNWKAEGSTTDHDCTDCPVNDLGFTICTGSPYTDWLSHHTGKIDHAWGYDDHEHRVMLLNSCFGGHAVIDVLSYRLAKKELDFLREILREQLRNLDPMDYLRVMSEIGSIYGKDAEPIFLDGTFHL